jgi:hypothetical protein
MLQLFSAECRRYVVSVIQLFRGKPRLLDTYELVLFDPGRIMLRGINASAAFCVVPGVPGGGDFSTLAVSCGTPGTRGINASAASRVAPVVMLHQFSAVPFEQRQKFSASASCVLQALRGISTCFISSLFCARFTRYHCVSGARVMQHRFIIGFHRSAP